MKSQIEHHYFIHPFLSRSHTHTLSLAHTHDSIRSRFVTDRIEQMYSHTQSRPSHSLFFFLQRHAISYILVEYRAHRHLANRLRNVAERIEEDDDGDEDEEREERGQDTSESECEAKEKLE